MIPVIAYLKPDWQFPVTLHFWGWRVPIHPVCDTLAYFFGFRLYLFSKKRSPGPHLAWEQSAWIFVGCIFGALIGAKLLAWSEAPGLYWALRHDPNFWFGGKTIVGGLLGGWVGIALAKKAQGITSSTGDACVYPLILGMCVGRIGCFLTGLSDNTCGVRTQLPWGVDYGDGVPRHPAQIYEILFLIALGIALWIKRASFTTPGLQFRWFMIGYLSFRFYIDFFKPHWTLLGGLSGIQWGCLLALIFCAYSVMKLSERPLPEKSNV
jgi:phosphatidylglycerol---prolipoprotein diacylglyceryl transferase